MQFYKCFTSLATFPLHIFNLPQFFGCEFICISANLSSDPLRVGDFHHPFFNNVSSQRLNVRVITISLIFRSSSTQNLVWPCTSNLDPSGSIPLLLPDQLPSSYQCAYTQLLLRPLPQVGLMIKSCI